MAISCYNTPCALMTPTEITPGSSSALGSQYHTQYRSNHAVSSTLLHIATGICDATARNLGQRGLAEQAYQGITVQFSSSVLCFSYCFYSVHRNLELHTMLQTKSKSDLGVSPCVVSLKVPGTSILLRSSCIGPQTSRQKTSSKNVLC